MFRSYITLHLQCYRVSYNDSHSIIAFMWFQNKWQTYVFHERHMFRQKKRTPRENIYTYQQVKHIFHMDFVIKGILGKYINSILVFNAKITHISLMIFNTYIHHCPYALIPLTSGQFEYIIYKLNIFFREWYRQVWYHFDNDKDTVS